MNAQTEKAYRKWRRLAEIGYGKRPKTQIDDLRRVDGRIAAAKLKYEVLLLAERSVRFRVTENG